MASCQKNQRKVYEKLPFEILDTNNGEKFMSLGFPMVYVGPKRYVMPDFYKENGLDVYNFEARPDDVYLVGINRSGTVLHSEMVWQIANDLDFETSADTFLDIRFPHIDYAVMGHFDWLKELLEQEETKETARKYFELSLENLTNWKGKRFIRSHMPLSLMPPHIFEVGAKVIYIARFPGDVLLSYYHFRNSLGALPQITFKEVFELFIKNEITFCPYLEHIKEGWEKRNAQNVLFIFYEDTIRDKRHTLKRIADFLGKKLSEDQLDILEDYVSLENFKNNSSLNLSQFKSVKTQEPIELIRKGKSGCWSDVFDEEMKITFNKWLETELKDTDLKFPKT